MTNLLKADLNLLRVLHVLLEEASVMRAAGRLNLTPSALSKSLHRLREQFNDRLLVRSGARLVPTPRAIELEPVLKQIFAQVETCLASGNFDPALATGRIRIAAPELLSLAFVPDLVLRLRDMAPNLIVESDHLMADHLSRLTAGTIDFVVNADTTQPADFNVRHIHSAYPVFWSRKEHPLTRKPDIDLADIFSCLLIKLGTQNMDHADIPDMAGKLIASGLRYKTLFDTTNFLIAIDVLMKTDALLMAPDYIARLPVFGQAVVAHPVCHIPAFNRFRINLSLVQNKRTLNSPLHRWIADEIFGIVSCHSEEHAVRIGANAHACIGT